MTASSSASASPAGACAVTSTASIVGGPDVGIVWPALFEHKALNQSSWTDLVKRGLRHSKPIYFAQCQLYMAYMELEVALLTAMNKDTQELYHEVVPFDPAEAQKLSDKAVDILRAIEAEELPPRIAINADFHLCRHVPLRPAVLGGFMSESFTPSDLQARAIREIKDWFLHRTAEQQVFRVFGYAGVGKTTLTRHAIDELGLETMTKEPNGSGGCLADGVLYAAFTGKAALVMTRKGTPASTIHSLIYRVSEATPEEIERVEQEIAEIRAKLPTLDPAVRLFEESRLRSLEIRLDNIHEPRFVFNGQSLVRDAALIVLDEVSMVGDDMARDLLAFGKPILVLGDPGQLPPIRGEGAFTKAQPDVMLTEIHRQAGESAIIRLATMARQGLPIPYGEHDAACLEDAAQLGDARADAARRPGDLRAQRHAHPAQHRHEARRRVRHRLPDRRAPQRPGGEDHLPQEPARPRHRQRHVPRAVRCARRERDRLLGDHPHRGRRSGRSDKFRNRPGISSTRATSTTTCSAIPSAIGATTGSRRA